MNITEIENELFEEWVKKRGYGGNFVKDGVPCPELFAKANYKITFVLKEAHDMCELDDKGRDMRYFVDFYGAETEKRMTWNNITRWSKAILEGGEYPQNISGKDRFDWLKQISFLNLKKVSGGSSSNPVEIQEFTEKDAEYIKKQIGIYRPDIIVCCGIDLIADCLAKYVFQYEGEWEHDSQDKNSKEYKFCWYYVNIEGNETIVLNFYHPLNMGTGFTNEELYALMVRISKKILNKA